MKVRNGYVSNSSSSSFLILGNVVGTPRNIGEIEFDFKKFEYVIVGKYLSEGYDLIKLTPKIVKWIENHRYDCFIDCENSDIYKVIKKSEAYNNTVDMDVPNITLNAKVMMVEADQHSSTSVEELEDNYAELTPPY